MTQVFGHQRQLKPYVQQSQGISFILVHSEQPLNACGEDLWESLLCLLAMLLQYLSLLWTQPPVLSIVLGLKTGSDLEIEQGIVTFY